MSVCEERKTRAKSEATMLRMDNSRPTSLFAPMPRISSSSFATHFASLHASVRFANTGRSTSFTFAFGLSRILKTNKPKLLMLFVVNSFLSGVLLPGSLLLTDGMMLQKESWAWQNAFIILKSIIVALMGPNCAYNFISS